MLSDSQTQGLSQLFRHTASGNSMISSSDKQRRLLHLTVLCQKSAAVSDALCLRIGYYIKLGP